MAGEDAHSLREGLFPEEIEGDGGQRRAAFLHYQRTSSQIISETVSSET